MPNMSGVESTLAIRGDPQTKKFPVLFVSGSLAPGGPRPERGSGDRGDAEADQGL